MPEPLALTLDDAAKILSVSPRTVRRLLDAGELSRLKIGRAVRVSTASLRAYVDRQINPLHNEAGVAVHGETTCHDVPRPRKDQEKASTNGRARRTGGPSTQTAAGGRLAAVLGFDATRIQKG